MSLKMNIECTSALSKVQSQHLSANDTLLQIINLSIMLHAFELYAAMFVSVCIIKGYMIKKAHEDDCKYLCSAEQATPWWEVERAFYAITALR